NRPTEATVSDIAEKVFEEPFEWEKPIRIGGPGPGALMVLHTGEDQSGQEGMPGLYSSGEASKGQEGLPRRSDPCLVIANYSGWGRGQLEGEFDLDSWLTLPANHEYVFWEDEADLWEVVVKQVNTQKLSDFLGLRDVPPDPRLN